ncbi:MAG: hypothetical protein IPF46_01725 [Saprospiraceae bacterium]|nr:hypothetical protein [Candidatus Vicinibacter affinis]
MNKSIKRYEYGSLNLGEEGFDEIHWKALGEYEQKMEKDSLHFFLIG